MSKAQTLYEQYVEDGDLPEPLERLRAFCSFAMVGADWVDVETYFDDVSAELAALRADAAIGQLVRRKLVSGNGVPVERCYVKAEEVAAIDAMQAAP